MQNWPHTQTNRKPEGRARQIASTKKGNLPQENGNFNISPQWRIDINALFQLVLPNVK
jgi:hypothetical protein